MNEIEILPLFPSALLKTNIKRNFTEDELSFVDTLKIGMEPNIGNATSDDIYVLDRPEFKNIREFIDSAIEDYMDNIVQPKYDTTCYVTQSWLTCTKPGEFHHQHYHPNSFISGVLYIKANSDVDKISFEMERHDHFHIEAGEYNLYNSKNWWVEVGTGMLILFPSHITHAVPKTSGDDERISIAFNTYLKGQLGLPNFVNELILK
jgi:uncharacterized protein (TIGR02466 family)